jgi:hypothetical protein
VKYRIHATNFAGISGRYLESLAETLRRRSGRLARLRLDGRAAISARRHIA